MKRALILAVSGLALVAAIVAAGWLLPERPRSRPDSLYLQEAWGDVYSELYRDNSVAVEEALRRSLRRMVADGPGNPEEVRQMEIYYNDSAHAWTGRPQEPVVLLASAARSVSLGRSGYAARLSGGDAALLDDAAFARAKERLKKLELR